MPYGPKRLTADAVYSIRHLYNSGVFTQRQLAENYNISQALVSKIVNEKVHKPGGKIGGVAIVRIGFRYGN
jgi:predicted XRE-type DNA-binding protein